MSLAVTINLTDRTSGAIACSISKSLTSRNSARLEMQSLDGSWTPERGQVVDIQLGGARKFVGTIESVRSRWTSGSAWLKHTVQCGSYDFLASKRVVDAPFHFDAAAAGTVIDAFATQFLGGENLTITAAAGATIGPGDIRAGVTVEEGLDELCALGGLHWDIAGAPGLPELRAYTRTTYTAPASITATEAHARATVEVERTRQGYANRVYARIASGAGAETAHDQFGDGSTRQFEMPAAIAQIVAVSVDGEAKTVAILDSGTTAQYYWQPGSSTVTQADSEVVLTGTDLLSVSYQPVADLVVLGAANATEVSARAAVEGGSGKYEVVIDAGGTVVSAAEQQAEAVLAARQSLPSTVTVTCEAVGDHAGLDIGQSMTITLPALGLSGSWLIESIEMATSQFLNAASETIMEYTCQCSQGVAATSDWANTLSSAWGGGSATGVVSATGQGGGLRYHAVVLTADAEIDFAAAVAGQQLVVRIEQDATGGHRITWSAAFGGSPVVDIPIEAEAVVNIQFVGHSDGKWWQSAVPG